MLLGIFEFLGTVPAGLIEDEDRVSTCGHSCSDLIEMKLHGFGVAEREDESSAGSVFGTYRTEQVGRLGALIVSGSGTRALPGPAIGEFVFWPTRISSWNQTSTGVPGASLARTSAMRTAKFF